MIMVSSLRFQLRNLLLNLMKKSSPYTLVLIMVLISSLLNGTMRLSSVFKSFFGQFTALVPSASEAYAVEPK